MRTPVDLNHSKSTNNGTKSTQGAKDNNITTMSSLSPSVETASRTGSFDAVIVGQSVSFSATVLLVTHTIATILGFVVLDSPDEPIPDLHFAIVEFLILFMMPPMLPSFVALHEHGVDTDQ